MGEHRATLRWYFARSLVGPCLAYVAARLLDGWGAIVGVVAAVALGHCMTQVSLHRTIHKISMLAKNRNVIVGGVVVAPLLGEHEEWFLSRYASVTFASLVANLLAGILASGWQGLALALGGLVVGQTASNMYVLRTYGPVLDDLVAQIHEMERYVRR